MFTLAVSSAASEWYKRQQFGLAADILGNDPPPHPRHSKQYRQLFKMKEEMQAERVAGFQEFIDDVQQGRFTGPAHVIDAPDDLIETFIDTVDREN